MTKNTGFVGIGIIVAIVISVVVIGGGVIYWTGYIKDGGPKVPPGKKEAINQENISQSNDNKELRVFENKKTETVSAVSAPVKTECNSSSKPFIKVLSPNGGEEYSYKDIKNHSIDISWESCNYRNTKNDSFIIGLKNLDTGKEEIVNSANYPENMLGFIFDIYYKHNGLVDSEYLSRKGNYKIFVCGAKTVSPEGFSSKADVPDCSISDYSDSYFVYKTDSKYAEIKSIYKKENKYFMDVSYFEIITGEEAYMAQIKEGWCDKKEECISDYYQKNLNKNETLEIDPSVDIIVETYLGSVVNSQYKKLDKFIELIEPGTHYLFYLKLEDNKVISILQFIGN